MRIAFIGQKGIPCRFGGVERHVDELAQELVALGQQVFVYTRTHYTFAKLTDHAGVSLISLPSIRTKHLDAISHTLLASFHALTQRYDIIHYQGVGPSLLSFIPRIFLRRTKVVCTIHCLDKFHAKWGKIAQWFLSLGEWAACRWPHSTIVVSPLLANYCQSRFGKNTTYIPNGIRTDENQNKTELPSELVTKLGEIPYILTCARLTPHKNIHLLIDAFKELGSEFTGNLVIVGDAQDKEVDYKNELISLAANDARIIFLGWQDYAVLSTLYRQALLYVHPSSSEGLSLTILEAMAAGAVVLVADIPENRQIIAEESCLFKNNDQADLKAKILFLLQHQETARPVAEKLGKQIILEYNWNKIAKETLELYKSISNV